MGGEGVDGGLYVLCPIDERLEGDLVGGGNTGVCEQGLEVLIGGPVGQACRAASGGGRRSLSASCSFPCMPAGLVPGRAGTRTRNAVSDLLGLRPGRRLDFGSPRFRHWAMEGREQPKSLMAMLPCFL